MPQWEPLAKHLPVEARRLATQLRRMKDRSAMTVPALAARTAQDVTMWERALAAQQLPPLHAVEVLAQACGADYDRITALWKLAERAAAGTRADTSPVPYPDPLDPLGPEEGLPSRRRYFVLLGAAGLLAAAALVAVTLTAGRSTGRAPTGESAPTAPSRAAGPATTAPGHPSSGAPTAAPRTVLPATKPTSTPRTPSARAAGDPNPKPKPSTGTPPTSAPPTAPTTPPTTPPTSAPPTATPTPTDLCLSLIVLGVCLG